MNTHYYFQVLTNSLEILVSLSTLILERVPLLSVESPEKIIDNAHEIMSSQTWRLFSWALGSPSQGLTWLKHLCLFKHKLCNALSTKSQEAKTQNPYSQYGNGQAGQGFCWGRRNITGDCCHMLKLPFFSQQVSCYLWSLDSSYFNILFYKCLPNGRPKARSFESLSHGILVLDWVLHEELSEGVWNKQVRWFKNSLNLWSPSLVKSDVKFSNNGC